MNFFVAVLIVGLIALAGWLVPVLPASGTVALAVPAGAVVLFLVGLTRQVLVWARSPVPFRIPTTAGQQKSLEWIRPARLDNPSTTIAVVGRMALEVLLFRSLFRNTKIELRAGAGKGEPHLTFGEAKWLWLAALAFHWSFLVILVRHLRFFMEPVPAAIAALGQLDGFFQLVVPTLYVTDVSILAALGYLLGRRLVNARLRYFSLATDYVALLLLIGVAGSGVLMRYVLRTDVIAAKELALALVTFSWTTASARLSPIFFTHLFLVSALLAYFPFSKLVHMGGVFLSPTRNLANTSRSRRHVNPWNAPVAVHTYEEWEAEFHDKIVAAGLPLDRDEANRG